MNFSVAMDRSAPAKGELFRSMSYNMDGHPSVGDISLPYKLDGSVASSKLLFLKSTDLLRLSLNLSTSASFSQ
jgi:hypothetical protein